MTTSKPETGGALPQQAKMEGYGNARGVNLAPTVTHPIAPLDPKEISVTTAAEVGKASYLPFDVTRGADATVTYSNRCSICGLPGDFTKDSKRKDAHMHTKCYRQKYLRRSLWCRLGIHALKRLSRRQADGSIKWWWRCQRKNCNQHK